KRDWSSDVCSSDLEGDDKKGGRFNKLLGSIKEGWADLSEERKEQRDEAKRKAEEERAQQQAEAQKQAEHEAERRAEEQAAQPEPEAHQDSVGAPQQDHPHQPPSGPH